MTSPLISVVIPIREDPSKLVSTLARLSCDEVEVVIVDGGSPGGLPEIAANAGAKLVKAEPGRAAQMNAGAAMARGEILLFLHADTLLPGSAATAVRDFMDDPRIVGGAFAFALDSSDWRLGLVAWGVNLRTRWFRMPYGDQALFVRATEFRAMGGFALLDIMEDFDFVRRLRRRGRLAIVPDAVVTSGRRWRANGVLRTTLVNWIAALLFLLRVRSRRIRSFYDTCLDPGPSSRTTADYPEQVASLLEAGASDQVER